MTHRFDARAAIRPWGDRDGQTNGPKAVDPEDGEFIVWQRRIAG